MSRWPLPGRHRRLELPPDLCPVCLNPRWICHLTERLQRLARWPRLLWFAFRVWRRNLRRARLNTPDTDPVGTGSVEKSVPASTEPSRR